MTGRLHVYAWDGTGRVYRHLGSIPGDYVPTAWWVEGNTIRLPPLLPPEGSAQGDLAPATFIEGRVMLLVPTGLALVIAPDSVPDLPRLPDWQPRARKQSPAEQVDA